MEQKVTNFVWNLTKPLLQKPDKENWISNKEQAAFIIEETKFQPEKRPSGKEIDQEHPRLDSLGFF